MVVNPYKSHVTSDIHVSINVKEPPKVPITFLASSLRVYKKNIEKLCYENFYKQNNIQLIFNKNIKEEHLGTKKLHLNRKNNSQTCIEFYCKNMNLQPAIESMH